MSKLEVLGDREFIFGTLFVVANKLDTLLERELDQYGMTAKQWFLSIALDTLFDEPPTIKEVARSMGSSHQNVKQVALKLEQKGLLLMEKDPKDGRATRLKLTEQSQAFWEKMQKKGFEFREAVFKDLEREELTVTRRALQRVWSNLEKLEND